MRPSAYNYFVHGDVWEFFDALMNQPVLVFLCTLIAVGVHFKLVIGVPGDEYVMYQGGPLRKIRNLDRDRSSAEKANKTIRNVASDRTDAQQLAEESARAHTVMRHADLLLLADLLGYFFKAFGIDVQIAVAKYFEDDASAGSENSAFDLRIVLTTDPTDAAVVSEFSEDTYIMFNIEDEYHGHVFKSSELMLELYNGKVC